MNLIFALTIIIALSVCIAAVMRIHPTISIATSLMSVSLLGYVLGLANALWLTVPVVVLTTLFSAIILIARRRPDLLIATREFFTSPGTVLFICYGVATFALSRPMLYVYWDEYSHWGLIVKAMYTFDALSPYNPATLIFPSYPPSAATIEYFISKLSPVWNEADSIWAYQLIFGSLFITFSRHLEWKKWPRIFIVGTAFLLSSVLFFDSFLGIIIEPLLAATFGFTLAMAWVEKAWDRAFFVRFGIAVSFLVLLKDSGTFLAAVALSFATYFYVASGRRLNFRLKSTWGLLGIWLVAGVSYASWAITLRLTNTHLMFSQPISLTNVWDVLTGGGSDFYREVSTRFNAALFTMHLNTVDSGVPFSWAIWFAILIPAVIYVGTFHFAIRRSWRIVLPALILLLAALVYQVGLLVLYVTRFSEGEALGLASMPRYLSTFVFGIVLFVTFVFIDHLAVEGFTLARGNTRKPAWTFISASVLFLAGVAYFAPLSVFVNHWPGGAAARAEFRQPYASLQAQAERAGLNKDNVVLSIAQHTTGLEHLMTMYQLMPANVLDWPYSIGPKLNEADSLTDDSINAHTIQKLLRSVDFVALVVIDDSFKSEFGGTFEDPSNIRPATLYKVACTTSGCTLIATE